MKGALEAIGAQLVNIALAFLLVVVFLFLTAYLDSQPSETDALQATADHAAAIARALEASRRLR